MTTPAAPLTFTRGPAMANRMMLAPLTNLQSHPDGTLSDDEINWLTMRATGGIGLVMTAAAHVQRQGQGFPGQLGIWSDDHLILSTIFHNSGDSVCFLQFLRLRLFLICQIKS